MKRRTETVSFRIDQDLARLIDEARGPFQISRGDYVRAVVHAELLRGRNRQVDHTLVDIQEQVAELLIESRETREGMERMLFATLTLIGKHPTEVATAAVRRVFGMERESS